MTISKSRYALIFICFISSPAFAVETAPQANYFVPFPDTAAPAQDFDPNPPQTRQSEIYPQADSVPEIEQTSQPETAPPPMEFYPQPATVNRVEFLPSPNIAPSAHEFIPQAAIAPSAQEFLP